MPNSLKTLITMDMENHTTAIAMEKASAMEKAKIYPMIVTITMEKETCTAIKEKVADDEVIWVLIIVNALERKS